MWQSTISLRYVSYKNADSNLHERICPMMAKNLLWSCAQIVAPRPPINPQRPNHAMERTSAVAHLVLVRPMKTSPLITILLLTITKHAFAQYEVRTSADGFSVISKVRGRTFSVDVPGKDIKTY